MTNGQGIVGRWLVGCAAVLIASPALGTPSGPDARPHVPSRWKPRAAPPSSCKPQFDSSDPVHGMVRSGKDYACAPLSPPANNTLEGCAAACCADARCQAFSWNAAWTLNVSYMGCTKGSGVGCCCLKAETGTLAPNSYPMNITSGTPVRTLQCQTDDDCSLNGVCSGGSCKCDPAWGGQSCELLQLVPPPAVIPAYPPPELLHNTTSWGGSVIADPSTGKFHMYVAEMINGCGMSTWSTNSIIRHAVSDTPTGPYAQKEVVMSYFAHNPTAITAPDGTHLIWHIGCGTPNQGHQPCTACANGVSGPSCHGPGEQTACTDNTTNILYSSSLDGPWQQLNAPFIKSATMGTPYQIDNPTGTFFPNGSLLMLCRGGIPSREAESDGVATAPSWRGPYTLHTAVGDNSSPSVEDPFVWQDGRGNFHALFHKFTDESPGCGGHAYSRDGFDWTLHNVAAYTTDVTTTDGVGHHFSRRERPHLLLDAKTQAPLMLITTLTNWSTSGANDGHDKAFTFAQEIAK